MKTVVRMLLFIVLHYGYPSGTPAATGVTWVSGDGERKAESSRVRRTPARTSPRRGKKASFLQCLPSKFGAPRPHVELVARDRLVARLRTSTEPLVLVSAPAGSGKTTSLMQWLAVESRPVVWLRLDGGDNDPLLLLRYLAVAFDRDLGVDPEVLQLLQLRSPPLAERVLPGLAASVAGARPFVLVLDDAHLMQTEEA